MAFDPGILAKLIEHGARLRVRSALNPILWLCFFALVPMMTAATLLSPPYWLIVVGCAPSAVALFSYLFLLFFDRDKLQSEDFQIKKQSLEMVQQKGGPRLTEADLVEVISRPDRIKGDLNE